MFTSLIYPTLAEWSNWRLKRPKYAVPNAGASRTLRPGFLHHTTGFTWRFMRCISSLLIHVPARKLAEIYGLAPSTILRIDRGILKRELPPPKLDGIEGILVDEKYLGPSYGFVTLVPMPALVNHSI